MKNNKRKNDKKKNYSFIEVIAYLLGISGCSANLLGAITSTIINLHFLANGQAEFFQVVFKVVPIYVSLIINLVFFIRLVIKRKEYIKFMQVSVFVNGLICFPIMLHTIGYVFINYYYVLAIFAGLCFTSRGYTVVIPLIVLIADLVMFGFTSIEVPHPMKLIIGPTISFSIVFIIAYVFNQQNMKDKQMIKNHEKSLELLAARDTLTNAYNRRLFDQDVNNKNFKYIIMIDIDHFKQVNDTYGHQAGDKVLKDLVNLLYEDRSYEFQLYRYGGEEFAILSMYDGSKTLELITKFMTKVRESLIIGDNQHITVSCGISKRYISQGLQYTIQQADDQLYLAKRNGRDCVYYDGTKINL